MIQWTPNNNGFFWVGKINDKPVAYLSNTFILYLLTKDDNLISCGRISSLLRVQEILNKTILREG